MRLAPLLILSLLAGCFGVPAGGADFGDTVALRYAAVDPATGEVLESALDNVATRESGGEAQYNGTSLRSIVVQRLGSVPGELSSFFPGAWVSKADFDAALQENGLLVRFGVPAQFEMGGGQSVLGFQGERRLVGMRANETRSFTAEAVAYTQERTVSRVVAGGGFVQSMPLSDFRFFYHPDPQDGTRFQFNILHEARVLSVQNGTVRYEVLAEAGQSAPLPFVGATIMTHVDDDGYRYELVPNVGQRFIVRQPQGQQGTPLGLDVGGYRTRGVEEGQIVYDYTPVVTELAERQVRFVVDMVSVEPVEDAVPTDNVGQRRSPVLPGHEHAASGTSDGHAGHSH